MKTNIKDYIKVYDDCISCEKTGSVSKYFNKHQCQLIIKCLDRSTKTRHTFYNVNFNHTKEMGSDPDVYFLKKNKIVSIGDFIKDQWFKIITEYILNWLNKEEKMNWYDGWNGYTFPKFIEYNKNTLMKKHCDHIHSIFSNNGQARGIPTLTLITSLNDNYSGGEIILCEKYKYKLKAGETIVFPSNFLYPHLINKITRGKRITMVSWVF